MTDGTHGATGDLFANDDAARRAERQEAIVRHSWNTWGWSGPFAGELCEVDMPIVDTPDGRPLYCYAELARLISLQDDGRWLAEIAMPEPWWKNGRRVLLDRCWIGPPRRLIWLRRRAA